MCLCRSARGSVSASRRSRVTTDDKTPIPEPTPFEKFETLTKRLLGVPKKEIAGKAQRPKKVPRIAKGR